MRVGNGEHGSADIDHARRLAIRLPMRRRVEGHEAEAGRLQGVADRCEVARLAVPAVHQEDARAPRPDPGRKLQATIFDGAAPAAREEALLGRAALEPARPIELGEHLFRRDRVLGHVVCPYLLRRDQTCTCGAFRPSV
jgi:hypothetical protein